MIEAEWLACSDPTPMLEFLREMVSDRKLRLFGVACCRWIEELLPDTRSQQAVAYAGGKALGQLLGQRTHELRPQEHRFQIEPQIAVVAGFETEVATTRGQKLGKLGLDFGIGLRIGRWEHRLLMACVRRFNKPSELATRSYRRYAISSSMRFMAASSFSGVS